MQTLPTHLQVEVAHLLPARLRLRLSHPPHDAARTVQMVKSHPGVLAVVYTAATRNLLIRCDPAQIAPEEIILRTALALSADHQLQEVNISASGPKVPLSRLAVLAGMSLLAGHLMTFFSTNPKSLHAVHLIGGLGTTAAVAEHIYLDLKSKAQFHPEVLSIGYLLTSLLRGKLIKGATVAWVMTFARHLIEPPAKLLKLETRVADSACDDHQCEYEAALSRSPMDASAKGLLARLPHLLFGLYSDLQLTAEDSLFTKIQKLSREHDDVLEGLENLRRGIRLRVGPGRP